MTIAEIEKHTSAQEAVDTCGHCGKPVTSDEQLYSITGAHWACHQQQVSSVLAAETPRLEVCRAGSAPVLHIVNRNTGTALCGYRPRNRAYQMRKRGGWRPAHGEPATCLECVRRHGSATVEAPTQRGNDGS
ncbi:hypothetical protein [Noviherbaspirillum pedocola]|uniref:Uncharacterized protein n=1 Tax=Noviherbaspirillum pedocola TaxID=2801341 RepID=A0A934W7A0_9BURK|nr:hypothetical protein [Noviherbaspirillum pedocola]MBK4736120.1 hypothetical protein [Noviherbaspirillum pedocola]